MIKRLFSNTGLLLKDFEFHAGINIILGKYSQDKDATGINGIGKSSLVRLIDYGFLSNSAEKIFLGKRYDFLREEKHDVVLEFEVDKTYFVKRGFEKKSPILFGTQINNLNEFDKSDLKTILTDLFLPIEKEDVRFYGDKFRTIFDFFIKDDLDNRTRVDPLKFLKFNSNAKQVAIYNFFLLDLPTTNLINYKEQSKEYNDFNKAIKVAEDKIKIDTGKSISEYRGERINFEQRINLLEESLDNYHFIERYKAIEKQLISITGEISDKLKDYNSLDKKLNKIRASYEIDKSVEVKEIEKIYNEVSENFGNQIAKTLNEVLDFKNSIIQNRKKYLLQKEKKLEKSVDAVLKEISKLEHKRSKLYKTLDESGALDSVKRTYEDLIAEKSDLEKNVQVIKQIDEYQEILSNLNVTISEVRRQISTDLKDVESRIEELRKLFADILRNAIYVGENYENAYFNISTNPSSNRQYLPFKIEVEIPKTDALGRALLKIVAYDLMVFLHNITKRRKLPNFLVHDGVFHGTSIKTKINVINYVYSHYLKNIDKRQLQYILTFNEEEIITPQSKNNNYDEFEFDFEKNIVAEFQDIPEKMIFKRDFK